MLTVMPLVLKHLRKMLASRPEGYVSFIGDCDDDNPNVNPEAIEVCDGVDNDCDSLVDDQDSFWLRETGQIFYGDGDGDGFGWPGFFVGSCSEQVPGNGSQF